MSAQIFHPIVARWFAGRFGAPTPPQREGWPHIRSGRDTLIAAPTGSGKTLAAFLSCLDRMVREGVAGTLESRTRVVYVSPLKALANDVRKNLLEPLAEIRAEAARAGIDLPEIRVAVRTGDTPAAERQRMLRAPPHVLVTTPESLYVLLTAEGGRKLLRSARTVIVDEIHAVAKDKRGAHLALSLERLEALCEARPARIGLSATQRPIEEIARFLVGTARVGPAGAPDCAIVDLGRGRPLDLRIEVPRDELSAVASREQRDEVCDRIAELIREHRTTLVFVNTRRQVERMAHALSQRLGDGQVAAHHGSLSRAIRLAAEEKLKRAEVKVVVATASLELGIDIGAVELVVQVESPRSFAVALQRVGRAGHFLGGVSKGRLFPLSRDQLVECAALVRGLRQGLLEETRTPSHPLDLLAQQIVAIAAGGEIGEDELYALCRRAWPYRDLRREDFDAVVEMHAEGVARRSGRALSARLHRDAIHRRLRGRRGARLAAMTCGGAIPDTAQYAVVAEPEGVVIGALDEDFAVESLAGDVFLLGNDSWRIRRVEAGRVRVENAHGAPPSVPFWNGEAPGRSAELSSAVAGLRAEIEPLLANPSAAARLLCDQCGMPEAGAEQAVRYLAAAKAALGALPTQETLVAERFFDESGGMQLVVHAPFGARQNRAFGLALRKSFCRTFDFELQAAATDEAVLISLGPQHSFPLESVFDFVSPETLTETLTQAALQAPMFGVRWRWNATRSLALLRHSGGKKVPFNLLRMRADDLLAAVFPAQAQCQDNAAAGPIEPPDHPLVNETLRDCLHEAMDLPGLRRLLTRISRREARLVARDLPEPSPLAHEILNSAPYAYLDDAPLEERRARAVLTRRSLAPSLAQELGALDEEAIALVAQQAFPDARDADELHDALLCFGIFPEEGAPAAFHAYFEDLLRAGRAARLLREGARFWVATERLALARAVGDGRIEATPNPTATWNSTPNSTPTATPNPTTTATATPNPTTTATRNPTTTRNPNPAPNREAALVEILRGWVSCLGPFTAASIAERLHIGRAEAEQALAQLELSGLVLRGRFTRDAAETEFCERTLLARIHRLTLGRLRREIEPVSTADLFRFLFRWQHMLPGSQLHGAPGLSRVIGQLQGFLAAASAWEAEILPSRIAGYEPGLLDQLCLSGQVAWGRLSCAPLEPSEGRRRAQPNRATPIALTQRDDLPWLLEAMGGAPDRDRDRDPDHDRDPEPDRGARILLALLETRGALFFHEIRAATGLPASELEAGLWSLVSAGLATSDGFGAVRYLTASRRRVPGAFHPLSAAGRWSLLRGASSSGSRSSSGSGSRSGSSSPFSAPPPWLEKLATQYLRRYGVVFRDLLAREPRCPPWREFLSVYRRLEARGELRGGRFAQAFSGEQFALPEALDALRSVRRTRPEGRERVAVSAADPLNLVGILTPGPRLPAQAGARTIFVDGVPAPEGVLRTG